MNNSKFAELISDIEKAADGASLRTALVKALREMNSDGGNALKFNDKDPDYFLWKNDFLYELRSIEDTYKNFTENPEEDSPALIQSGNLYNYLSALMDRLDTINGTKKSAGTAAQVLKELSTTKGLIADAIEFQGGTIEQLDTFEDYAQRILNLHVFDYLHEASITENGTKKAEDEFGSKDHGWNVVKVNVKPKIEPKLINTLGDHEVPVGTDAWNPVTIDVPGLKSKSTGSGATSGSGGSGISHKTDDDLIKEYAHLEVDTNGLYTASEQKMEAIASIDVNVTGIDPSVLSLMKFTVEFRNYDETTLEIQTEVIGGKPAVYGATLENPKLPEKPSDDGTIYTFSHWEPNPSYVDHDMICYAQFTEAVYYTYESNLSWQNVLDGDGQIGDIKILNLMPYTGPEFQHSGGGTSWMEAETIYFGPVRMVCVDDGTLGDQGFTTWVSMDLIDYDRLFYVNASRNKRIGIEPVSGYYVSEEGPEKGREVPTGDTSGAWDAANKLGWANSPLRVWLNTDFLNQCIPKNIRERIIPVTKTYYNIWSTTTTDTTVYDAYQTALEAGYVSKQGYLSSGVKDGTNLLDGNKVWIPSVREIFCSYSKEHGAHSSNPQYEADQASKYRTMCVEADDYGGGTATMYTSFGQYLEPTAEMWANNRQAALEYIYYDNNDKAMGLKHIHYYPFGELPVDGRAYNDVTVTPAAWPTRSQFQGKAMLMNQYGNSKADMSRAADEELSSNTSNIAMHGTYYADRNGLCFGFTIGKN